MTALDRIWKALGWSDGQPVTRVQQSDGTYAEGIASLNYGWDSTSSLWTKLPVDHTSGNLNVNIAGGSVGGPAASTSGGASPYRLASSAATTNATNVKASAGTVYGVSLANTNASLRYLHLYDKASSPTVGSDTPVISFPVPASGGGIVRTFPTGIKFTSGISFAMTTDAAATNSAVSSGDLVAFGMDYF